MRAEIKDRAVWLAVLVGIIPLLGWWTYGLFDLDEGFYAAVTAEMNRRGEWIIPLYNGHPWFEKPILLYWVAKPCLAIFGDAVGPRLPSILATIGTYCLIAWFAKRHFRPAQTIGSVLVASGSLIVIAAGRMMLTDPLLLFCLTGMVLTFWESLTGNPKWRLIAAGFMGLAVLAKGPVACIEFACLAGITYWRQPDLRPKFKGGWLAGTAIFLLIVASWYVPAYLEDGHEFVQKFLIEQNIGRFAGGDEAHTVRGITGLIFYPVIILVGFAPWSGYLYGVWKTKSSPLSQYLTTWFLVILVLFTAAGAKLPSYVLPMAPAVALLVGPYISRNWYAPKQAWFPVAWLIALGAFAQWGFSTYYYGGHVFKWDIPGFHAEVQRMAKYVRANALPTDQVVEYRLGRQQTEKGTGKPKIQETTHPSTLLYLQRDVIETDDWSQILASKQREWIITRWNRVSAQDLNQAKGRVQQVNTPFPQDLYALYLYTSPK